MGMVNDAEELSNPCWRCVAPHRRTDLVPISTVMMRLSNGYALRSSGVDSAFVFTGVSEVLDVKEEEVWGEPRRLGIWIPSVRESGILFRRIADANGCRLHKP